jgi:uncharacterized protein (TIGR04552 family)
MARHPRARTLVGELQAPMDIESSDRGPINLLSGKHYRVLNFVVDLPVRIDELLPPQGPLVDDLGRIVFALVEFQVLDAATARRNEEGDSSHERYKKRQSKIVLRRLSRGLVVPKKQGPGKE